MDIKKIEELRKLQEGFSERVGKQVERLNAGEQPLPESLVPQQREMLREAEERLAALRERRERVLRDLDAEIAAGEGTIESLRAEIAAEEKGGGSGGKKKGRASAPPEEDDPPPKGKKLRIPRP